MWTVFLLVAGLSVGDPLNMQTEPDLIFVGDIMLARDVERNMDTSGNDYPYEYVMSLLKGSIVVGNFEGSMPVVHRPTPDFNMRFSVTTEKSETLINNGFTHMSQANNHALDYGQDGYDNAALTLGESGLVTFGHPQNVSTTSVEYVTFGTTTAALIGLSTVAGYPQDSEWLSIVEYLDNSTDIQIVYIHWGSEYALIHNVTQEEFAHKLIDAGVDIIVGHHPHVVQDVERYDDGLIFYSLGNFVFDQYFSPDVQQGLVLHFRLLDDGFQIKLLPISSELSHAQPRPQLGAKRSSFLKSLADRSEFELQDEIVSGQLFYKF